MTGRGHCQGLTLLPFPSAEMVKSPCVPSSPENTEKLCLSSPWAAATSAVPDTAIPGPLFHLTLADSLRSPGKMFQLFSALSSPPKLQLHRGEFPTGGADRVHRASNAPVCPQGAANSKLTLPLGLFLPHCAQHFSVQRGLLPSVTSLLKE